MNTPTQNIDAFMAESDIEKSKWSLRTRAGLTHAIATSTGLCLYCDRCGGSPDKLIVAGMDKYCHSCFRAVHVDSDFYNRRIN